MALLKTLLDNIERAAFVPLIDEKRSSGQRMLEIHYGEASHPGKIRPNNEDAVGSYIPPTRSKVRSHGYLFALADGVGSSDHGEVAAATAISVVLRDFAKAQEDAMLSTLLPYLMQQANSAIYHRMLSPRYLNKKMATTLLLCALRYDQAIVSHVGDSRCYLIRGGRPRLITQDHTVLNEQKRNGVLSPRQVEEMEDNQELARSLGPDILVTADTAVFNLMAGDVLVLCTDGLHRVLTDSEIAAVASKKKGAGEIARDLVSRAVTLDGSQNTTVQVILIKAVERVGTGRRFPFLVSD